jgi:hypothetical protein
MRRRRIDWDEEIRKTEQIRRKGLKNTALGCIMSFLLLVGVRRMHPKLLQAGGMLSFLLVAVATVLLIVILFRRSGRKRDS